MHLFRNRVSFLFLLCTAAPAGAQIDSSMIEVRQKPVVDSILFSCPVNVVQVVPVIAYPGLEYTIMSIAPGTLALPPPNTTGLFNMPGATGISVMLSNHGCLSDLALQTLYCNPLGLHVIDFSAALTGQHKGLLRWQTRNEQNTSYYLLERSPDATSFLRIARMDASGQAENSYQWTDSDLQEGRNYYRIRQVDKDGQEFFTEIRVLALTHPGQLPVQLYPNPTNGQLNLALEADHSEELLLRILNAAGQIAIPEQRFALTAGKNVLHLQVGDALANGTYVVHYRFSRSGHTGSIRFLKQGD